MSNNNFLSSGIDSLAAVTDGSLGLFGSTIGATNLISGFPVKVNASQQLYATNLSTSDVTGLSANLSTLNNKTQNIDAGGTSSGITQISGTIIGPSYTEGIILSMPEVASIPAVPAGYGYLWSDTSNDLHFKTSAGDAVIGGTGVTFLPLAGGTMTGDIDMNGWNIRHIFTITDSGTNTLKGARNLLCNNSLTMTAGNLPAYVGTTDGYVQDSGVVASSVVAGPASAVSGHVATYNGTTGKIIQDSGASLSQYLPLAGGTMSGAIAMGTNNITNAGTISGATNSRTADNIVSNAGASTSGNVASFSDTTGKVVTDSGVVAANIVTGPASVVGNRIATFSGTTGKIIQDSGTGLNGLLSLTGAGTMTGNIVFTAGKTIQIPTGSNGCSGSGATLAAGTVTVATTAVASLDLVLLMRTSVGGTPGFPVITISNGVSFTITSSSNTDTSRFSWVIIKSS